MKAIKTIIIAFLAICATSCVNSELYKKTDYFVEQLNGQYERYGILDASSYSQHTEDGKYVVTPIGRLVCVKILDNPSADKYESLRKSLERHYKGDPRVKSVYVNAGGTVMIDCR